MTVKHTPTNWNFKHEFAKHYSITHNGYWIGRMRGKENAQLVSAAPDLLDAAIEFCRKVESGEAKSSKSYAAFKSAIAKATGKSL